MGVSPCLSLESTCSPCLSSSFKTVRSFLLAAVHRRSPAVCGSEMEDQWYNIWNMEWCFDDIASHNAVLPSLSTNVKMCLIG